MSTVKELIEICKNYGLPFSKKNKSELQEIIKQFEQKADIKPIEKDDIKPIKKDDVKPIKKVIKNPVKKAIIKIDKKDDKLLDKLLTLITPINKKETNGDEYSMNYLYEKEIKKICELGQSDYIQIGNQIENFMRDIIVSLSSFKNIKEKTKKGEKEIDHLFLDETNGVIIGAEIKTNLYLDTEKTVVTMNKCNDNLLILQEKHVDSKCNMYLVTPRYYTNKIIPKILLHKFEKMGDKLLGINEYLELFGIPPLFNNEKEYKTFINRFIIKSYDVIDKIKDVIIDYKKLGRKEKVKVLEELINNF